MIRYATVNDLKDAIKAHKKINCPPLNQKKKELLNITDTLNINIQPSGKNKYPVVKKEVVKKTVKEKPVKKPVVKEKPVIKKEPVKEKTVIKKQEIKDKINKVKSDNKTKNELRENKKDLIKARQKIDKPKEKLKKLDIVKSEKPPISTQKYNIKSGELTDFRSDRLKLDKNLYNTKIKKMINNLRNEDKFYKNDIKTDSKYKKIVLEQIKSDEEQKISDEKFKKMMASDSD